VFLRQQAVFGVVGAEFEEGLVVESGRGHGRKLWNGIRWVATVNACHTHRVRIKGERVEGE
jgi:hypothetical protein